MTVRSKPGSPLGPSVAIGIGIAVAVGVGISNMGIGIAVGLAAGLVVAAILKSRLNKE
jgi:hypothetical protein